MTSALEQYSTATSLGDEILEREIGDFMTPGCVCISDDATVEEAAQALTAHRVHAVLVLGARNGTPLGWVTARGLLGWVSLVTDMASEMIYPLLPLFLTRVLGASAMSLGIIEGVAEAASSVLKIAAGQQHAHHSTALTGAMLRNGWQKPPNDTKLWIGGKRVRGYFRRIEQDEEAEDDLFDGREAAE